MFEKKFGFQRFYSQYRCVEYVMNFDEAVALVSAISSQLQKMARNNSNVSLLFALNPNKVESTLQEEILTDRILICVDSRETPSFLDNRNLLLEEPVSIVVDYYDI